MSDTIRTAISPDAIAEILRQTGYRATVVEHATSPQVQSAAQGLGFFVSFGNTVPDSPGCFVDCSFHCWITLQGELPPGLVEHWNRSMRFARLFRNEQVLVLTMDVIVTGGVTEAFLCAQCDLWDRIIRDFIRQIQRPAMAEQPAAAGAVA